MTPELTNLIEAAKSAYARMTPEEKEEMVRRQIRSWVRAEMGWPKPKFRIENGVKVYEYYEDYLNG